MVFSIFLKAKLKNVPMVQARLPGRPPAINAESEKTLIKVLATLGEVHFALSYSKLQALVEGLMVRQHLRAVDAWERLSVKNKKLHAKPEPYFVTKCDRRHKPGWAWLRLFMRRNKELSLRLCQNRSLAQARVTAECINA
jgi:hypothetical protein